MMEINEIREKMERLRERVALDQYRILVAEIAKNSGEVSKRILELAAGVKDYAR